MINIVSMFAPDYFKTQTPYNEELFYSILFYSILTFISCQKSDEVSSLETEKSSFTEIDVKVDSFLSDLRNSMISALGSADSYNREFPIRAFESFEELNDFIDRNNNESESITSRDDNFISYLDLFELYIDQSSEINQFLDSLVEATILLDSVYLTNLYNQTIAPVLVDYPEYFEIVEVEEDSLKYVESTIDFEDLLPVLNPLGLVIIEESIYHFKGSKLIQIELKGKLLPSIKFSLNSLNKHFQQYNSENLQSRSIVKWEKRCRHKENNYYIISDQKYDQRNGTFNPSLSATIYYASVRAFKGRLWGSWYDAIKATQITLAYTHIGNTVVCSSVHDQNSFSSVEFSNSDTEYRSNRHNFTQHLPCAPCWQGYLCTSQPNVTYSYVYGEIIIETRKKGTYSLSCTTTVQQ